MALFLLLLAALQDPPGIEKVRTVASTHGADLVDLEFSPDGKVIVTRGPHDLTLWETATAKKLGTVAGRAWLFSPDSTLFLTHTFAPPGSPPARDDAAIEIRTLPDLAMVRTLPADPVGVSVGARFGRMSFLDGDRIALGERASVAVVDLRTGTRQLVVPAEPWQVADVALVGDRLFFAQGPRVRVFTVSDRKEFPPFDARTGISRLTALGDHLLRAEVLNEMKVGEVVAINPRHKVEAWDLRTNRRLELPESVASVVLSGDGKTLAAATLGGDLLRFDLEAGTTTTWPSGRSTADARHLSSSGTHLMTDELDDGRPEAVVWDLSTRKKVDAFPLFDVRQRQGDLVVLRSGSTFKALDLAKGKVESMLEVPGAWTSTAGGASPLAAGRTPGRVDVYDLLRQEKVVSIALPPAYGGAIAHLGECRDGRHVLSLGQDGTVRGWELPAGKQVFEVRGFDAPTVLDSVAGYVAETQHRVLWSTGTRVRVVSASDGKELFSRKADERDMLQAALSPDGTWFVTWSLTEIVLWDSVSFARKGSIKGRYDRVVFAPDGGSILHTDGRSATLVDLWDPAIQVTFATDFHALTVAPDGASVVGYRDQQGGKYSLVKYGIAAGRVVATAETDYLPVRQAVSGNLLLSYEPYAVKVYGLDPFRRMGTLPGDHRGLSGFVGGHFCSLDLFQREFAIWHLTVP